jgi:hypothetical protein
MEKKKAGGRGSEGIGNDCSLMMMTNFKKTTALKSCQVQH